MGHGGSLLADDGPALADLAVADADQVGDARDGGDDGVGNDEGASGVHGEAQAQTAVDDAKDEQDTAVPDVNVADGSAALVLLVQQMVRVAEEGLNAEQGADDGTNAGVSLSEVLGVER
jgi:hypothetical protein